MPEKDMNCRKHTGYKKPYRTPGKNTGRSNTRRHLPPKQDRRRNSNVVIVSKPENSRIPTAPRTPLIDRALELYAWMNDDGLTTLQDEQNILKALEHEDWSAALSLVSKAIKASRDKRKISYLTAMRTVICEALRNE